MVDAINQTDKAWLLDIQRKLYTWSRVHPDEAWREMWNWMIQPQNLRLAWRRVARNHGARTAGVDGWTVRQIEHRIGVERFLTNLQQKLRDGSYCPQPVRRVLIPKAGKPGQHRPLGVPTVEDRVVQAAILHLLEPIVEARFYGVSFGFRPKRAVRDAIERIRRTIKPKRVGDQHWPPPYHWVIEGDIKGCFDNIDHHVVMERLRKHVSDRRVCRLVLAFLKSGILSEGAFVRTDEGTPQGGILSPLLANVVLSAIEERYQDYVYRASKKKNREAKTTPVDRAREFRTSERSAGRPVFYPVRYADDFVVLVSGSEEQARQEKESLARFLAEELKLTLSPEKTHVTALSEGFQFLGHRIRLRWEDRYGYWPRVEIPREKTQALRHKIKQMTQSSHLDLREVIEALNPVLLGWGRFYQHCYYAKDEFNRIDWFVSNRIWCWLRQKHPKTGNQELWKNYRRFHHNKRLSVWADHTPLAMMRDIPTGRYQGYTKYPDYAQFDTGEPGA